MELPRTRPPVLIFGAVLVLAVLALRDPGSAAADGVDVTMCLVEQTLSFLRSTALDPPPDHVLLKAGALRVCGADLSQAGCLRPGSSPPGPGLSGPEANRAWREILESALAAESLRQGAAFDKTAFQRFVMDAMVEALGDPASFLVLPATYRKIAAIPGSFTGFGFTAVPVVDGLLVTAVHDGSPAARAGLARGARIVSVNGKGVTGYLRAAALAAIWGADGERLRLEVARGAASQPFELEYRPWTFAAFAAERRDGVLVLRINTFAFGLADRLRREIGGPCPPAGIVIDLRDASGGDDEELVSLADLLLGEGPIGSREMREALGNRRWAATAGSPGERTDIPVAVVVGPGTADLAEVLASALRVPARALLVGGRSAGLDTRETMRPFPDGSAILLTSTRLRGPGDASLAEGVLPHVETSRPGVVDLAAAIIEEAGGEASLETLLAAARRAVAAP